MVYGLQRFVFNNIHARFMQDSNIIRTGKLFYEMYRCTLSPSPILFSSTEYYSKINAS